MWRSNSKKKEGEPKLKTCPKCGKDLPKKPHGFGMRCHKMKKFMKFMHMMKMFRGPGPQFGPGPECFGPRHPPCPPGPPHHERGLEVHHYIHFGPPPHHGMPPMLPLIQLLYIR